MPLLGAHQSIAGGFYKAVDRAAETGCDTVQIFTAAPQKWPVGEPADDEAARFRESLAERGIVEPNAHSSYLINLASPDAELWRKSVDGFALELRRAEKLGLAYVVVHPGSHTTASEEQGINNVIRALNEVHRQTRGLRAKCLLENTAGQGTNLGHRFEHLATILDGVRTPERLDVCFDTCHAFAAGYGLGEPAEYDATMREFDRLIGLSRIKVFHLNDSKREQGSRVDRHEHIGQGKLGKAAFRNLLNDPRFQAVPMYLETPKEDRGREDWDVENLRTLRRLIV